MKQKITDICIIGAGPAGAATAIELAKRDVPCTLIDKSSFPREKICGDGISGRSLAVLETIDPGIVRELKAHPGAIPSWGVKFISPNHKEVKLSFKDADSTEPSGYVIRRLHFDNILAGKIRKDPGISFRENYRVSGIKRNGNGFTISNDDADEEIRCRMIILSTGSNSGRLIKDLGLPESPGITNPGIGIRTYFNGVEGMEPDHKVEMHFYKEMLPWYLWVFPMGGSRANVGLGLLHNDLVAKKIRMKQLLSDALNTFEPLAPRFRNAEQEEQVSAERLQYYTGQKQIAVDGALLAGDAACLIDPFTGEGISNALISGICAAETAENCVKNGDFSYNSTIRYQQNVYRKIGAELDLGLRLQNRAHNAFLINLVVNKARKNRSVRELLAKMIYNVNNMGELASPLFYLKLALNL